MRLGKLFFIGLAAAALFTGCKEDTPETPSITVEPGTLQFVEGGETKTVTVTANRDWVVEIPESVDWITVTPSQGSANTTETVTVKVEPNTDIERKETITFNASVASASLEIVQEGKPIEITTIADFSAKTPNETDWYYLKGTITEIDNTEYGNLTIEDNTGSIYVYGLTSTKQTNGNDKSFASLGLKVGDVVTICGICSEFNGTKQAGSSKIPTYYVTHTSAGDMEAVELESIEDVFTTPEMKVTVKGQVIAVSNVSFVMNDGGKKNLLVYAGEDAEVNVKVGDNISVTGLVSDYGGLTQLTSPETASVSEQFTVNSQDARALSGKELADFAVEDAQLVTVEAAVVIDDKYTNIYFDNDGGKGSVVSSSFDKEFTHARVLTITGYYGGRNGIGYFCIIPTDVDECTNPHLYVIDAADPGKDITTQKVSSATGKYVFEIIANTAWTATSSDTDNFVVAPAFGNASDNDVTVTYTANEGTTERKATVTVASQDNSKSFKIEFTQSAPLSADAAFVKVSEGLKDYTGTYLIVCESVNKAYDGSRTTNFKGNKSDLNNKTVTISDGKIAADDEIMTYSVSIEKVNGGYAVKTNSGYYLNNPDASAGLDGAETYSDDCLTQIEYLADQGGHKITASGGFVMLYNKSSDSNYFRFYNPSNIGQSQYVIPVLYRFQE